MDIFDAVLPSNVIGCCRICLGHDGDFYDVFSDGEVDTGLKTAQILRECTSYTVELADNISHQICRVCLENAIFAHRFRRQADNSYRFLTGVMEMPQKSAIMMVEIGTQTDKECKQEFEQLDLEHGEQVLYSIINNNNDNHLNNNNNSNCTSVIPSDNQLTYENQTVGFESMLLYNDDIIDGDDDDDDDDDTLMPPISSSSLTSTVTEEPSVKSLTPLPELTRVRRQYRSTKHCAITTDCKLCGAKHNCLLELREHLMIEHMFFELTLGLRCRLCNHEYSRKDHLVRHLRNIHKVSHDRENGRIKIEQPQTITMGQCMNENEETDDMGTVTSTNRESPSGFKMFRTKVISNRCPSTTSLSSLSSVSLSSQQESTELDGRFLRQPEFVRSGDELLNFKVKLLRTNCSEYDDPLNDAINVVNVDSSQYEIEDDNMDESDEYSDGGGAIAKTAKTEADDDDDYANMDDDNDDVDGASDIKTCFSFTESNKSLAKYFKMTSSFDQETDIDNNADEDEDGDGEDGGDDSGDDAGDDAGGDGVDDTGDDGVDDTGDDGSEDAGDDAVNDTVDDTVDDDDDDDVETTNMLLTITSSLDIDKIHQCHICERKFQRKYHLGRHMLVHTKVRAFSCEKCQRTFARSDQKAQHRKEGCKPLRRDLNTNKGLKY